MRAGLNVGEQQSAELIGANMRAQFGKPEQHYKDEAIRENSDRSRGRESLPK